MADCLSEISNMPIRERKLVFGTKGTRQGTWPLTDLRAPLQTRRFSLQRNLILGTDIHSEATNRDLVGVAIRMPPNVMWLYDILERGGERSHLEGRDHKGKTTAF